MTTTSPDTTLPDTTLPDTSLATIAARPHLHHAPVAGGAYVGGSHSQFVLSGSDLLFRVVDTCLPLLEAPGATEDDLVHALGNEKARPAVRCLVAALREHGMLLDAARFTAPPPDAAVRAAFPEMLAHLEATSDDPYGAFTRLRAASVVVVGPPAMVGPAHRGLVRAGVGLVTTAGDAPRTFAAVDALIIGAGSSDEFEQARSRWSPFLPAAAVVLPVLLRNDVMATGPVLRHGDIVEVHRTFERRVAAWARDDRFDDAARPVADALAGALAAHLLTEYLGGIADAGTAHVIHGPRLAAERVTLATGQGVPRESFRFLEDTVAQHAPAPADALATVMTLCPRWTGIVFPVTDDELPQLPLALRQVEHRAAGTDPSIGWAGDQQTATVAAVLDALRRGDADVGAGVGAAGLTETHWLLDGALRLLVADAEPAGDPVTIVDAEPESQRIWHILGAAIPGGFPAVHLLQVPGVDWLLARVTSDEHVLGLAWGADPGQAVHAALGTALGRAQADLAGAPPDAVAPVGTDALLLADAPTATALARRIVARGAGTGTRFRGRARPHDVLLGELALFVGPITAETHHG